MSELSEKQRDHIDSDKFAFPKERKEPIHDAAHVRNAIARFDQVRPGDASRRLPTNMVSRFTKRAGASSARNSQSDDKAFKMDQIPVRWLSRR